MNACCCSTKPSWVVVCIYLYSLWEVSQWRGVVYRGIYFIFLNYLNLYKDEDRWANHAVCWWVWLLHLLEFLLELGDACIENVLRFKQERIVFIHTSLGKCQRSFQELCLSVDSSLDVPEAHFQFGHRKSPSFTQDITPIN